MADERAQQIFQVWSRRPHRTGGGYSPEEHFRDWANRTVNRFFDIGAIWPEEYIRRCCVQLKIPCPDMEIMESYSEDSRIQESLDSGLGW